MSKLVVMQMIDSLIMGGAERVAVNNANTISEAGYESHLCVTRTSGPLEAFVNAEVKVINLHKRCTLDRKSIGLLVKYIKEHKIDVIHAHSTSFIVAVIAKLFTKVRVVWHDHNGNRVNLTGRINTALRYFSYFFDAVVVVNNDLYKWACEHLLLDDSRIIYIQNYADLQFSSEQVDLPGTDGRRIVVVANLRNPKDHLNLIEAFHLVDKQLRLSWTLLFVGEDKDDEYSAKVKASIEEFSLNEQVKVLGVRSDTAMSLKSCEIEVKSS